MFIYNWLAKWTFKDCSHKIMFSTMTLLISNWYRNILTYNVLMLWLVDCSMSSHFLCWCCRMVNWTLDAHFNEIWVQSKCFFKNPFQNICKIWDILVRLQCVQYVRSQRRYVITCILDYGLRYFHSITLSPWTMDIICIFWHARFCFQDYKRYIHIWNSILGLALSK